MPKPWMIYGANGYTGELIAREAASRGLKPVLAGRTAAKVEQVAANLGLEARVFDLGDVAATSQSVEGMGLVLHCAGPFSATAAPMMAACLGKPREGLLHGAKKSLACLGQGEAPLAAHEQCCPEPFFERLLARTAAFLLLKDSRASYVIEGEDPPQDRVQRWGSAIGQAGRKPIDLDELLRLQQIVIGDSRFVDLGLRRGGGFVGEHDRATRAPLPEHVSARADDLPSLMDGMIAFDRSGVQELDAVIAAAVLAFGFVFVHPFEDGNGRIHRYLIHHVLAARGFNPPGVVFPVSATIRDRLDEYLKVLQSYSQRVLPLIKWKPTKDGNVEVLNDTADFYRYFDATPQAEFLYSCVRKTVEEDLPQEADYLLRYDAFKARVEAIIDMPDRTIDLLFRMLRQNKGKLSKRAREKEFAKLTADEARNIERAFDETFAARAA